MCAYSNFYYSIFLSKTNYRFIIFPLYMNLNRILKRSLKNTTLSRKVRILYWVNVVIAIYKDYRPKSDKTLYHFLTILTENSLSHNSLANVTLCGRAKLKVGHLQLSGAIPIFFSTCYDMRKVCCHLSLSHNRNNHVTERLKSWSIIKFWARNKIRKIGHIKRLKNLYPINQPDSWRHIFCFVLFQ